MVTFNEQRESIDALAKKMNPTRNGHTTAKQFIVAVEEMFRSNNWSFSGYCDWANGNYAARQAQKAPNLTKKTVEQELNNLANSVPNTNNSRP